MGSIKAYVGNLKKIESANEFSFEGLGVYDGQSGEGTFPWETDGMALTANLATTNAGIRAAIIAGSETAGNSFNPVTDNVIIAAGPSVI